MKGRTTPNQIRYVIFFNDAYKSNPGNEDDSTLKNAFNSVKGLIGEKPIRLLTETLPGQTSCHTISRLIAGDEKQTAKTGELIEYPWGSNLSIEEMVDAIKPEDDLIVICGDPETFSDFPYFFGKKFFGNHIPNNFKTKNGWVIDVRMRKVSDLDQRP